MSGTAQAQLSQSIKVDLDYGFHTKPIQLVIQAKSYTVIKKKKEKNKHLDKLIKTKNTPPKVAEEGRPDDVYPTKEIKEIKNCPQLHDNLIFSCSGIQKKLLVFFYSMQCRISNDGRTLPLSISEISKSLNFKKDLVKNAIARLQKKELVYRKHGKIGKSGWTVFKLNNQVISDFKSAEDNGILSLLGELE
ncbi:MAG: hypothetical protein ACKOAD_06555 [Gammaproteobacteria bacterium]